MGASLGTSLGPHLKFPGAGDTPQEARALTQGHLRLPASAQRSALPARSARAAGEDQLRAALQFSLPSFPRFG